MRINLFRNCFAHEFHAPFLVITMAAVFVSASAETLPVPDKIKAAVVDRQDMTSPDRVRLTGWLGTRINANVINRLETLDTERLLEGYYKRPGRQEWDGEHVGKWLHAATLAWVYTGDPALRAKLDRTAAELCQCQLDDGYLGTYLDKDRWTSWDVWSHKYNLIGLVTYMRYTGNLAPMPTCRRIADLLCNTFGDGPGQRDIIKSGEHMGMAPTSALEPMVLLYRLTGEPRYLEFCNYIFRAWEQPNGPHIISRLMELGRVDKVGNAKAYEMLSCLNGALELYRTTGNQTLFNASLNAWQDIVDHRLYLTGSASSGEHFQNDDVLPNDMASQICETCVTVTWMQFNLQLLRLTGNSKFADQLENSVYNHLLAAQNPRGDDWCYYTPLEGQKPYDQGITCCHSSGPRGIALIPTFALTTDAEGVVVNFYDAGNARLNLHDHTAVAIALDTHFPSDGLIQTTVNPAKKAKFTVKWRIPAWCRTYSATLNGEPTAVKIGADGYAAISRVWRKYDRIELQFKLEPRVVLGDHLNQGKIALLYGPLVLAADEALLGGVTSDLRTIAVAGSDLATLNVIPETAPDKIKTWPDEQVFRINATVRGNPGSGENPTPHQIHLMPFADAGASGTRYQVWLPDGR